MHEIARLLLGLAAVWAALALTTQVLRSRAGGRRDYSRPTGSAAKGIIYNFTTAMRPSHKESVRLHPGKFAVGMVLHLGTLLSLVGILLLICWPESGAWLLDVLQIPAALGLGCGAYLFVRRLRDENLRAMSAPDDYLAILVCCGLLALVAFPLFGSHHQTLLMLYGAALFLYMPLGKLRHVIFFFVARADLGRRLGRRGVYPPHPHTAE